MLDLNIGVHGRKFDTADGVEDFVTDDGAWFRSQNVDDILAINAAERMENDRFKGFRRAPVFRKVASIPVAAVDLAKAQGMDILNDPEAMLKFLNDPNLRGFRTSSEVV